MSWTVTRSRSSALRTLPSSSVPTPRCRPTSRTSAPALAKLKRRGPRRDAKAVDVRERVDQFLGETFAEVVLVAAGTHVRERKNSDGGDVVRWRR